MRTDDAKGGANNDGTIIVRDGRKVGYSAYGPEDGFPSFYFHGTPGSRLQPAAFGSLIDEYGIRLVALERPGFGLSDPKPGRSFRDWTDDVVDAADHLGWDQFAVIGVSGGGAYVAACARYLPERLTRAMIIAGMGPATRQARKGMHRSNRLTFTLIATAPWLASLLMKRGIKKVLAQGEQAFLPEEDETGPDADLFRQLEVREAFLEDLRACVANGVAGPVEDLRVYTRPWDFRLEDIEIPVHLMHGEEDRNVPIAVARQVAAAIPICHSVWLPGAGHSFACAPEWTHRIMQVLVEGSPSEVRDGNLPL